jgi:hypothetical protein
MLWSALAVLYAGLVGVGYFGKVITKEGTEPVLNVIDVGLYLALVEYTGGLSSAILWFVLPMSVVVAALDVFEVHRRTQAIPQRRLDRFARYSATGLYMLALLGGVVWASLDDARTEGVGVRTYLAGYGAAVGRMFLVALVLGVIFYLLSRLVSKRHEHRQTRLGIAAAR